MGDVVRRRSCAAPHRESTADLSRRRSCAAFRPESMDDLCRHRSRAESMSAPGWRCRGAHRSRSKRGDPFRHRGVGLGSFLPRAVQARTLLSGVAGVALPRSHDRSYLRSKLPLRSVREEPPAAPRVSSRSANLEPRPPAVPSARASVSVRAPAKPRMPMATLGACWPDSGRGCERRPAAALIGCPAGSSGRRAGPRWS
jgi:hypothetical protein